MIYLEYTREEVRSILNHVKNEHTSAETLFNVLNCELPSPVKLERFKAILPKAESAIAISFLRQET